MAETKTNKERLKEITDGIEQGIKELFQSEKDYEVMDALFSDQEGKEALFSYADGKFTPILEYDFPVRCSRIEQQAFGAIGDMKYADRFLSDDTLSKIRRLNKRFDADWRIDIKKSTAYPPSACIDQLRSYASNCCIKGETILQGTHKAAVHQGHELQQLWIKKKKNNKWYFVINREHQMIKDIQKLAEQNPSKAINALLSFLEEAIPAKASLTNSQIEENVSTIETQGIDITVIENLMKIIYDQRLSEGMTPEQAKSTIYRLEPFNKFPDKIEEL